MKLALYSGGSARENRGLMAEALSLLEGKRSPTVVFVPSESEDARADFRLFQKKFAGTRVKKFYCIGIDQDLSREEIQRLFSADVIFLGGGNTYYFLKHLREKKLLRRLRAYVKKGGVLMGLSAGGILMTPSIMTASVPALDSDKNEVGLKDLSALGLVPFEFSPHYYSTRAVDRDLLKYSRRLPHPIYACADGQGIIVENGSIRFIGSVNVFHNGTKYQIQ